MDLLVTEGFEELEWLEIEDIPETDRSEEKQDDIGVGRKFGDDELDVLCLDALASSSSVGMAGLPLAAAGHRPMLLNSEDNGSGRV